MRASGAGRPLGDGLHHPAANGRVVRASYNSSDNTRQNTSRVFTSGVLAQPGASKDGQEGLSPPLAAHKPQLSLQQEKVSNRNITNGFSKGRARDRCIANKRKMVDLTRLQPLPQPFNRATAPFGAPDLASAPEQPAALPFSNIAASAPAPKAASPAPQTPPAERFHTGAATALAAPALDELTDEDFDAGVPDEKVQEVYKNECPPDVHVVNTLEGARKVMAMLMSPALAGRTFGCDTEVMDIDVTSQSPCCHGKVICFSVYCGPDVDFSGAASQDGAPARSMLWVDTWLDGDESRADEAAAIVETFRPFWESAAHRKVWHNYSFDRHVIERMGIRCAGFDGDTMHMARLEDSSRIGRGGYSLEALTSESEPSLYHIVKC